MKVSVITIICFNLVGAFQLFTDHQRQSGASTDNLCNSFIRNVFATKLNRKQDNLYIERNDTDKYHKI